MKAEARGKVEMKKERQLQIRFGDYCRLASSQGTPGEEEKRRNGNPENFLRYPFLRETVMGYVWYLHTFTGVIYKCGGVHRSAGKTHHRLT